MRDLKIRAFSEDGLHSYVTHLSVVVIDVNDNWPKFDMILQENLGFQFCVVENSSGLLNIDESVAVGRVHASDIDSGVNGQVVYRLDEKALNFEEATKLFEINGQSGEIFLKSMVDREVNETIVLSVIASDMGLPEARSTPVQVRICVLDINDNKPEFGEEMPVEIFVEENTGDLNLILRATDADSGANGTVFFYIQEDKSNKFVIDPKTSQLTLTGPLDYEVNRAHNLTIVASDIGKPKPQLNIHNIRIRVLDQNDNPPVYDRHVLLRSVDLKLDSISDTKVFIGDYQAFDKDGLDFQKISYRITRQWQANVKNTARPIFDNEKLLQKFTGDELFEYNSENGTLNANVIALNRTKVFGNFYAVELEAFDPKDKVRQIFYFFEY